MKMKGKRWKRADDLALITLLMDGYTTEAAARKFGVSLSAAVQRASNIQAGAYTCRKAKREGLTPDQFLATLPLYAPKEKPDIQPPPDSFAELENRVGHMEDQISGIHKMLGELYRKLNAQTTKPQGPLFSSNTLF